jgi:hypothetical protein
LGAITEFLLENKFNVVFMIFIAIKVIYKMLSSYEFLIEFSTKFSGNFLTNCNFINVFYVENLKFIKL